MDEKLIPKEASGPNESLSESNSLRNSVVAIETLHSDAGEPDPKPMVEVRELLQLILPVHTDVTNLTRDFSRLMLPGLPFLFLYELVRKVMQCQNVVKPLVVIAVIGNLGNLGAGYGLAYHTSMGFIGIAVARSLGNITLTLLLVPYFMWRPHQLRDW
ncbi:hypothetical protein F443_18152 [Phytophthora nicotianae P1569]|uniref:Uncharacterized protein n=1 Tax=Phytophthora nicotianae P1569 TaxID=1317065 RepID=V9EAF9_PHYNI|nr:hypothetical protein F443_18152 [Phytophthora nicotianae P1569]